MILVRVRVLRSSRLRAIAMASYGRAASLILASTLLIVGKTRARAQQSHTHTRTHAHINVMQNPLEQSAARSFLLDSRLAILDEWAAANKST